MNRTAHNILVDEVCQLRNDVERVAAENRTLRAQLPPPAPTLASLSNGQAVSDAQLAALNRAQRSGSLKYQPGQQVEVHNVDRTGRRTSHFFGDPSAAWDQFRYPARQITRINTEFK